VLEAIVYNEDAIPGLANHVASNSVHLTVSSIPFGQLFTYSGKNEDIGNNSDGIDMRAGMFGLHMRFLIEEVFRVMVPGCNVCIHIQQLLTYKNQHGVMGRRDFRGAVVDLFTAGGFEWKGEVVIPKNPQIIAQRLNLHSLQFITGYERSARDLAPAINDYVMIFQKPGEAPAVRSLIHTERNTGGWVTTSEWIKWAHGVWTDILEIDVLDGWKSARSEGDEKHVCPLQLEVIRRPIRLYTNPGETVLDPFMGIGSTAYVAIEQGRSAIGFELKESYHAQAVKNVALAQRRAKQEQMSLLEEVTA
jgi:DNA modification methylase